MTTPQQPQKISPARRRTLAVFTIVVTVVAVCSVAFTRTDSGSDNGICAAFQNSFGLYPGAAVTIRGIQIGTVESVTPRGTQVQVDMTIDDRTLGRDVGAAIVNSSILTDRRVELVNTEVPDGGTEFDGTCIPESRTAEPTSVPDALNSFSPGSSRTSPRPTSRAASHSRRCSRAPTVRWADSDRRSTGSCVNSAT
ncbi:MULTISPECIES: MlaD family protein [Gordonia]|uniref:MlaD family protein n=1 Tax=Gordonia amicalis TaxID=89053 RepID=A0AAE4R807_9ACTN|nr:MULTISPECIES: MlaD family protein [Gordonia]ATD69218.1 MCE family protein [Gordonia sp. 1D]KAF0968909.1 hypothetical protein BPODLACK_02565 [Gordonia sp. YY1]MBA5847533.1 MCE family protein [Gordonia amicalis]MCZ0911177.1 MlaD family protein [Gordonia amicalis]MCZ4579487.1 MlaD family protein [Gordonia amicalis]